ncbi:GIY-YIG nuclease family protein [Vibrio breoganii]
MQYASGMDPKKDPNSKDSGFIYILQTANNPNEVKIGLTKKPIERMIELYNTSIALPPILKRLWSVQDVNRAEKLAHEKLARHRVNDKREFFNLITLESALTHGLEIPTIATDGLDDQYIEVIESKIEEVWFIKGIDYQRCDNQNEYENYVFNTLMSQKFKEPRNKPKKGGD